MYGELNLGQEKPQYNPRNGQFIKGRDTWNKGMHPRDWMDGRKYKKVRRIADKNLEKGRGWNRGKIAVNAKAVIRIDDEGKWAIFPNSVTAAQSVAGNSRELRRCCQYNSEQKSKKRGVVNSNHKYHGYRWYHEADDIWTNKIKK